MGCFGTTGFLSRVPIISGQRVVCFIASVNNKVDIRQTYYPDSIVAPYCLPIRGKYDDYGCIDNIDRDANVEVIEKYFGCSIEDVLNGVERLLYGRTIKENIEYWSKDDDDWHREEVQKYKNIVPLEKGLDDMFYKDMRYQWVLLFEHEEIYDKMANEFKDVKIYGQEESGIDNFFYLIDRYLEFYEQFKKSSIYNATYDKIFRDSMPNMFKYSIFSVIDTFEFECKLFENDLEKISNDKKEELKNLLKSLSNIAEISRSNERRTFNFIHEGSSNAFMAIFRQVDYESLLKLYTECKDELRKIYGIWWFCNTIPMHFGISHTGSQQYDEDLFKKFNIVINNVIDKEFSDYSSETTINTSYLVGRELENGTVEYQKNSLGGFTFSPYIDGDTCRWKTKNEASDEIDRYKELDGCLLWQLDEIKVVKPIDY